MTQSIITFLLVAVAVLYLLRRIIKLFSSHSNQAQTGCGCSCSGCDIGNCPTTTPTKNELEKP
ncbi:MAG: FeoB-associated Cys-rich membrane protein [Thermodesulfobacteriota bacterium]